VVRHKITLMYRVVTATAVIHLTHDRAYSGGGPDARSVNGRIIYCARTEYIVLLVAALSRNFVGDGKQYNIVGRKKKFRLPRENHVYRCEHCERSCGVNADTYNNIIMCTPAHAWHKCDTTSADELFVKLLPRMVYRITHYIIRVRYIYINK